MILVLFGIKKRILLSLCVSLSKNCSTEPKGNLNPKCPTSLPFMEFWFGLNNKNLHLQS